MFKSWLKSVGLILGFFIAQFIGVLFTVVAIAFIDIDWMYEIDDIINNYGVKSIEYISKISEIIYPALIVSDILILIPFIIILFKRHEKVLSRISYNEFLFIVSLGIVINFIVSFIIENLPKTVTVDSYNNLVSSLLGSNILICLLITGIIAPIVEELIFRYAIMKYFKSKGVVRAILYSALLFGLAHMNIIQSTYAFVIGIILGYTYIYKNNLSHSILMHIVINSSSVIYEFLPVNIHIFAFVFVLFCFIYCIYFLITFRRCNNEIKQ